MQQLLSARRASAGGKAFVVSQVSIVPWAVCCWPYRTQQQRKEQRQLVRCLFLVQRCKAAHSSC